MRVLKKISIGRGCLFKRVLTEEILKSFGTGTRFFSTVNTTSSYT